MPRRYAENTDLIFEMPYIKNTSVLHFLFYPKGGIMKKQSFFRDFIKEQCDRVYGKVKSSYMGRSAFNLNAIQEQEDIYIYKPWKYILGLLGVHYIRFGILTLLSFFPLFFFIIPAWAIILYEFYVSLKLFEKYNISAAKTIFFSIVAEILFIAVSPFIRKGIKWLFFGLVSGSFWK